MTTGDIHNFNTDSEETDIVKESPYLGSVHSNGDCSHEVKRRLGF